jgi:hypothetical protein
MVTLMASPLVTVWMPSTVRSSGRAAGDQVGHRDGARGDQVQGLAVIDRRLDQVLVDELFGAVQ